MDFRCLGFKCRFQHMMDYRDDALTYLEPMHTEGFAARR